MTAVWVDTQDGRWVPLTLTGFAREQALEEAVFASIEMLPLAKPSVIALARQVQVTPSGQRIDLIGVDTAGTLVLIEVKLHENQESRKAVVSQVLSYAASLRGTTPEVMLERLQARSFPETTIVAALSEVEVNAEAFNAGLADSLATGRFRLVLVLDEAPPELVRLVGYLEDISDGRLSIDLIAVNAFHVGDRTIVVPQRVDPQHSIPGAPPSLQSAPQLVSDSGSDLFARAIEAAPAENREAFMAMLSWARALESLRITSLITRQGSTRTVLTLRVPERDSGLASLWNDRGFPFLWLHGTVITRLAPESSSRLAEILGKEIGFRIPLRWSEVTAELRDELEAAYREAATGALG